MPFGQLNVAIQIYNICKGRLGSRGGGGGGGGGGRGCISERRHRISEKNRPLCKMVVFIVRGVIRKFAENSCHVYIV